MSAEPLEWPVGLIREMGRSTILVTSAEKVPLAFIKWSGSSLRYTTRFNENGRPCGWKDATTAYAAFPKWLRDELRRRVYVKVTPT